MYTVFHAIKSVVTAGLFWLMFASGNAVANAPLKVLSLDWTQTETLLALGVKPVGAAENASYNSWISVPALPSATADIGLRAQPNLERLAELKPDRIFISPYAIPLMPKLERIAPVFSVPLYENGDVTWQTLLTFTRTLAKDTHTESAAETLIQSATQQFATLKKQLPGNTPPLLVIQFMDAHYVRVFGQHSLYQIAAAKLGLTIAWQAPVNNWGFDLVGLDQLLPLTSAQLVIIDRMPAGVVRQLQQDVLWQYLINNTRYPPLSIRQVWSFGAIPSAVRFARLITAALNTKSAKDL